MLALDRVAALAMTAIIEFSHRPRAIQSRPAIIVETGYPGVLDPPPSRGVTWLREMRDEVAANSAFDEREQVGVDHLGVAMPCGKPG